MTSTLAGVGKSTVRHWPMIRVGRVSSRATRRRVWLPRMPDRAVRHAGGETPIRSRCPRSSPACADKCHLSEHRGNIPEARAVKAVALGARSAPGIAALPGVRSALVLCRRLGSAHTSCRPRSLMSRDGTIVVADLGPFERRGFPALRHGVSLADTARTLFGRNYQLTN